MGGARHHLPRVKAGKGPRRPGYQLGRGLLRISYEEHRVGVLEGGRRVGTVQTVGEQLDLAWGVGLQLHQELAGDGPISALRLWDMDAHQPVDGGDVMLPATPYHGVAVVHQEPIPRVQRCTGKGRTRGPIEQPQRQAVPPVRDVEHEAMIAALGIDRREEAHIRGEMHQAVVIARGEVQVGDIPVARMGRIHRKMRRAIQLFIGTDRTKGTPVGEDLPRRYLKGHKGHAKLSLCSGDGRETPHDRASVILNPAAVGGY